MAKKRETRHGHRIMKAVKSEFGGWWFKVHGGPFQAAGIPDWVGCVNGVFIAMEIKRPDDPKSQPSELQLETIGDIIEKGGGYAAIIETKEQALDHIREAIKSSEKMRRFRD